MTEPGARAADIAAKEVETIIAAAQKAGEQMKREVERELAALRKEAVREAEEIKADAKRVADAELETARLRAIELDEDTRREAQRRIDEAQRAADDVLAEAKALSNGLRQLAAALTDHAARILREVESGHRRLRAELRAATSDDGGGEPRGAVRRARSAGEPARANPFDEIELPRWVERDR